MPTNPTKPNTPDLQPLCSLTASQLRDFLHRVETLYHILHKRGQPPEKGAVVGDATPKADAPPVQVSGLQPLDPRCRIPELPPEPVVAIRRTSMRPPTPGSVRAGVYDVLEGADRPMRPGEVALALAMKRGVQVTDQLKASVGEVLRNPHDPRIRKVAPRTYAIAP